MNDNDLIVDEPEIGLVGTSKKGGADTQKSKRPLFKASYPKAENV